VLLVVFSGLASLFLVLNYALLVGFGWSPMRTALTGLGFPVGIFLTTGVAQRFATTQGRKLIQIGLSVLTAGMVLLIVIFSAAGTDVSFWQLALPILVMGLGMGLCVSILTTVVLAAVPDRSAGAGSGVTNAVLQFGAAAGVAVVGTLMFALATDAGSADPDAVARSFADAATKALWYNAAVFLLAALLTPLLPRAARGEGGPPEQPQPDRDPAAAVTTT
jgi:MFS family permease